MQTWTIPGENEQIPQDERIGELSLYSEEPNYHLASENLSADTTTEWDDELLTVADMEEQGEVMLTSHEAVDSEQAYQSDRFGSFVPLSSAFIEQGIITIGEPKVGKLPNYWREDRDYYLILQPFTVEEPKRRRNYSRIDFEVSFLDEVIAYDMYPQNLDETREVEAEITVTPNLTFQGVSLSPVEVKFKIPFNFVTPTIVAMGEGTKSPRWTFKGNCARHGNKAIALVLQVPKDSESVSGYLQGRAAFTRGRSSRTDPFLFNLNFSGVPDIEVAEPS